MSQLLAISIAQDEAVPPSPAPYIRSRVRAAVLIVGIGIGGLGTWSALAPLESAAAASGVVISESSRKTIQHLEGGIIRDILVKDGDAVTAGQPLLRLDDTKARTTLAVVQGQLWDAEAREARLLAERDEAAEIHYPAALLAQRDQPEVAQAIAGQQKIFETRHSYLESRIAATQERISQVRQEIAGYQAEEDAARRRIALIKEEIVGIQELVSKGLERKSRLLQLQRDLADIEGRRGDLVAQMARARQSIAESEINIITLRSDHQKEVADDLRDTQGKRHQIEEQVQQAAAVLARTTLTAPVDGTITDLKVHTPGGVINAGETVMTLVPRHDGLVIDAEVRPDDIDRVHEGLPAHVRLLPYKQRRTPPLAATVIYVSADRLIEEKTGKPYYEAKLRIDKAELAAVPEVALVPGMPAEAMIKTGETTVALYALAPIVDSFHHAFREK